MTPHATPTAGAGLRVRVSQRLPMPLEGEFTCEPGELLALVGPSGAGKTSMLRALAGLMRPASAAISVGEEVWCDTEAGIHLAPQNRHVGLVFQNYALMPHLSALDDVSLSLLHLPSGERRARARQWLAHVRITDEQQARRPAALSGGQQQRVAVARALAREPRLLLLDEPFSAVDQMSRQGLYELLAELRRDMRIPIVLVTHDLVEARQLADSLVVMDAGRILQQGPPAQVYRSPRNARVADLMGVQNRFHGRWLGPLCAADTAERMGWLEWLSADAVVSGPRLRVKDKGRLAPGQMLTWVVQGDGLHLGGWAAEGVESESRPQRGQFLPDLPPHSPAMGQKDGEKWTAAGGLQPTTLLPPSLLRSDGELDAPTLGQSASHLVGIAATVTEVRNLGETSVATAAVSGLPTVSIKLIRSGPLRRHLALGQTIQVGLDCEWVHVMPTRSA